MGTKALLTAEQFGELKTADTVDYELIEGELIPLSSGTYRHNKIRDLIGHLLWMYFTKHRIGECVAENDCRITSDTVRRPDLSIYLAELLEQIDLDKIPSPFPPDIAIEVLSPSESAMDIRHKVRDYLRAGSREVWLVDHSNFEVMVHTGNGIRVLGATDRIETPLLPGFSVEVNSLLTIA